MVADKSLCDLIFSLAAADGVSGAESGAASVTAVELEKYMPVHIDALGNVIGEVGGAGVHVLLDAHLDRIGLVVTGVDKEGFVRFDKCGGCDARTLEAHEVVVVGRERLFGVVISTPPHLAKEDSKDARKFSELAVDIGLSAERARELVSPGDRIMLSGKQHRLCGGLMLSPALDDRAGVAAILRAVELLSKTQHGCRLTVMFSAQEETGGSGARVGGFASAPDEAIAVDVSFAGAPDIPEEKSGKLGAGPMIGFSPLLDASMSRRLEQLAGSENIPYQAEVMGGRTGTNADDIQNGGRGVKTALLSIPLRNMHTCAEIIHPDDVENTARLIAAYVIERGRRS